MKRFREMNTLLKLSALAGALALAMGPASAADVYLAAKPFTKDLPVSGGTVETVPMWGYVLDADVSDGAGGDPDGIGDCFAAVDAAARMSCIELLPDPTLPGPRLTVDPTDLTPDRPSVERSAGAHVDRDTRSEAAGIRAAPVRTGTPAFPVHERVPIRRFAPTAPRPRPTAARSPTPLRSIVPAPSSTTAAPGPKSRCTWASMVR